MDFAHLASAPPSLLVRPTLAHCLRRATIVAAMNIKRWKKAVEKKSGVSEDRTPGHMRYKAAGITND